MVPSVYSETPAFKLLLSRIDHISTYACLLKVRLWRRITVSSHRIVYLVDLKHSWNRPQQKETGRGLCGAVTHHMKPPEPQCGFSLLYVCMHVYVCVCLCV